MKNPLPATLYVVFHNQSQYEILQKVIYENASIILNVQDLSQMDNLQQQETRIVNIIKLSNFVQVLCFALMVVLAAVIFSFAIFFLKGIFSTFRNDMQVKKLMGATKSQIVQPFLWSILYAMIGGFVISLLLVFGSLTIFDHYMLPIFQFALTPFLLEQWILVVAVMLGEIVIIMGVLMVISYRFITKLHKKLK
jgi:cell division protein FtsX